eukprot:TRINITY_DN46892_c0_g1_i1.p1 TRINITY_DN46892_c0_g1~~TRINITY_DN46892_c0_g1_i1.p1  ORF type:complete len:291 (-),score=65.78 TRINITY_DN46892_c0_g1_i1:74-946(-)
MGATCSHADYRCEEEDRPTQDVKVLVVALDYKRWGNEEYILSCPDDAVRFLELAETCGATDITTLSDCSAKDPLYRYSQNSGMPTKQNVLNAISQIARRCQPDDVFFFFYAGHGVSVEDTSGDEKDGQDEAFALVGPDGKVDKGTVLIDDDFTQHLLQTLHPTVRVICFNDCCHSGTILDLNNYSHDEAVMQREIVCISGARDDQTAKEEEEGGGCATHAMLGAIDALDNSQDGQYSINGVFNEMQKYMDTRGYSSKKFDQNLVLSKTSSMNLDTVPWPFSREFPYSDFK